MFRINSDLCEQLNITTSPETAKLPWGFIFISPRNFRCAFWFLVRRCLFAGTLSSRGSVFSRPMQCFALRRGTQKRLGRADVLTLRVKTAAFGGSPRTSFAAVCALTSGSAALVEGRNKIGANDNLAVFSRAV